MNFTSFQCNFVFLNEPKVKGHVHRNHFPLSCRTVTVIFALRGVAWRGEAWRGVERRGAVRLGTRPWGSVLEHSLASHTLVHGLQLLDVARAEAVALSDLTAVTLPGVTQ